MNLPHFHRWLYFGYRRAAFLRHRLRRKVTAAGALALMMMFGAGALGLDTNLAMSYQVFTLMAAMILVALIWTLWRPPLLRIARSLPRLTTAGTPFRYSITVVNPSEKPLQGLGIMEDLSDPCPSCEEFIHSPEPGEQRRNLFDRVFIYYRWMWLVNQRDQGSPKHQPLPKLSPRGQTSLSVEFTPQRRGYLRFATTEIINTDPFGFFRARRRVTTPQSVLVLPRRYPVSRLALPGNTAYQLGGVSMASSIGESEEFVALRDYRRGDPLRRIHWKSSAKAGQLIVKEFEDEFFVRQALILDTFQDKQPEEVFEEAVSVAASFACAADTQDSLLDLMFVGARAYCFTAGRGVGHLEQMLEILACVQPSPGERLDALTEMVAGHLDRVSGCICVLLEWDTARQRLVEQIRGGGIPALVIIIVGTKTELDPGPMRDQPGMFHVVVAGEAAEILPRL